MRDVCTAGLHQVKELMKALEDAERARMELEDEYARVRANLLEELSLVKSERDAFREKCEVSAGQRQCTLRVEIEPRMFVQ